MEVICCLLFQGIGDFSVMKKEAEISYEILVFI